MGDADYNIKFSADVSEALNAFSNLTKSAKSFFDLKFDKFLEFQKVMGSDSLTVLNDTAESFNKMTRSILGAASAFDRLQKVLSKNQHEQLAYQQSLNKSAEILRQTSALSSRLENIQDKSFNVSMKSLSKPFAVQGVIDIKQRAYEIRRMNDEVKKLQETVIGTFVKMSELVESGGDIRELKFLESQLNLAAHAMRNYGTEINRVNADLIKLNATEEKNATLRANAVNKARGYLNTSGQILADAQVSKSQVRSSIDSSILKSSSLEFTGKLMEKSNNLTKVYYDMDRIGNITHRLMERIQVLKENGGDIEVINRLTGRMERLNQALRDRSKIQEGIRKGVEDLIKEEERLANVRIRNTEKYSKQTNDRFLKAEKDIGITAVNNNERIFKEAQKRWKIYDEDISRIKKVQKAESGRDGSGSFVGQFNQQRAFIGAVAGGMFGMSPMATVAGTIAGTMGASLPMVGAIVGGVTALTAAVGTGVGLTKKWVEVWYEYKQVTERARVGFGTLLGSFQQADSFIKSLVVELRGLGDFESSLMLSKRLLQIGLSADEARAKVKQFVDLTVGIGIPVEKHSYLAKAITDVMIAGKLKGQEVIQFQNAGVMIKPIVAEYMNITLAEVDKQIRAGKITSKIVAAALTEESKYYRQSVEEALTLPETSINRVKIKWAQLGDDSFGSFYTIYKETLKKIADDLEKTETWDSALSKMVDGFYEAGQRAAGRFMAGFAIMESGQRLKSILDAAEKGLDIHGTLTEDETRLYNKMKKQAEETRKNDPLASYRNPSDDELGKWIENGNYDAFHKWIEAGRNPGEKEARKKFYWEGTSLGILEADAERIRKAGEPIKRSTRELKNLLLYGQTERPNVQEEKKGKTYGDSLEKRTQKLQAEITALRGGRWSSLEFKEESLSREKSDLRSILSKRHEMGMSINKGDFQMPQTREQARLLREEYERLTNVYNEVRTAQDESKKAAAELATAVLTSEMPVLGALTRFQISYKKLLRERRNEEQALTASIMLELKKRTDAQEDQFKQEGRLAKLQVLNDIVSENNRARQELLQLSAMEEARGSDLPISQTLLNLQKDADARLTPVQSIDKNVQQIVDWLKQSDLVKSSGSSSMNEWLNLLPEPVLNFVDILSKIWSTPGLKDKISTKNIIEQTDAYIADAEFKKQKRSLKQSIRNLEFEQTQFQDPQNWEDRVKDELKLGELEYNKRLREQSISLMKDEQDVLRQLAALRNSTSEEYKQVVERTNNEINRSHITTAENIIRLQEEIKHAGENASEEFKETWLNKLNEIKNRDKDAIKSQIESQLEIEEQTKFSSARARAYIMEEVARSKGYTEIFSDAFITAMNGMSEGLSRLLTKASEKLGVVGKFISEIGSNLMRMVSNRLIMKIVDWILNPEKSGKNEVDRTRTSVGNLGNGFTSVLGNLFSSGGQTGGGSFASLAPAFAGIGGNAAGVPANGNGLMQGSGWVNSFFSGNGGTTSANGNSGVSALAQMVGIGSGSVSNSNFGGIGTLTGNNGLGITSLGFKDIIQAQNAANYGNPFAKQSWWQNLKGGIGSFWKDNKATIGKALPFLGFSLGSSLGGQSKLGSILSGIGSAGLGLVAGAALTGSTTGLMGAFAASTALGAATLVAAPILIGLGIWAGKASQRRKDEEAADPMWKGYLGTIEELIIKVRSGSVDGDDALRQAADARKIAVDQIMSLKTRSVRDSRIKNQIGGIDSVQLVSLKQAVEEQKRRRKEGALLIPEFATGGIVPGAIGSPQMVLAHGGELIVNPQQQTPNLVSAAWNAGVPGVERIGAKGNNQTQPQKIDVTLVLGTTTQNELFVNGAKSLVGYNVIVTQVSNALRYID